MSKTIKIINENPDLSIIVSMYNEEDSLDVFFEKIREALSAISNYSYEIICIDDGSSDKTYELLLDYANKDNKIKIIKLFVLY